ncbi:MAG: cysteine hydrolase family protein [Pseudomonadales bacterium]
MKGTALLIIDFQNDYFPSFEGAKMPLYQTEQAAQRAAELLEMFRAGDGFIVHVRHEFEGDGAPFFAAGSQGALIHPSVAPIGDEVVVLKHHINSFRDTKLAELLNAQGIEKLVVVGAMSHMCIDAAVRAGVDLGFDCQVVEDACATLALEYQGVEASAQQVQASFMAALKMGYCEVVSSTELLPS